VVGIKSPEAKNSLPEAQTFALISAANFRERAMFIGFFLLALGILFLLKNLDVIHGDIWQVLWPLLIIAFGASLVFRKRRR
jgi:hypothetical protein